ncbi:MAG: Rne/Rng family ribonuclease [Lentisphaeria bacterium]
MKQLLINCEGLETRLALVEDRKLQDYFIERSDERQIVGSIFKGVIQNLEPSLQAAFVNIGTNKNAFLHYWDMLPATKEVLEEGDVADNKKGGQTSNRRGKEGQKDDQRNKAGTSKGRSGSQSYGVDDIPRLFPEQSEVLVQVTKGPIGTKGARVTTNLSIPGRYLVFLPNSEHIGVSRRIASQKERQRLRGILRRLDIPKGSGVICRTLGSGKSENAFQQDFELLLSSWQKAEKLIREKAPPVCVYQEPGLAERSLRDYLTEDVDEIITDNQELYQTARELTDKLKKTAKVNCKFHKAAKPIFEQYKLTDQIDNMFNRKVELPSGGHICIDETEALIAIDVNSGKNRAGKDHPETILNTNLEAVDEIARQLRLRNLGGLIVADFIDMRSREDRRKVYQTFKDALAHDRAKTRCCPISSLGLIEMTRQREHESLLETVFTPCPYCSGKGMVKSPKSISVEIQRRLQSIMRRRRNVQIRVYVHPHVLQRLREEDDKLLKQLEQDWGGELTFRADEELHLEEYRMVNMDTGKIMYGG